MVLRELLRHFRDAGRGILIAFREERSFRIQLAAAIVGIASLPILNVSKDATAIVLFIIAVVLAFELLNSAIERIANATVPEPNPLIRAAKDSAAGAVLLVAFGAVAVAVALLLP